MPGKLLDLLSFFNKEPQIQYFCFNLLLYGIN